ncbi:DNA-binding protein WhiA [Mycoplasmopsis agassizii]|uniref:DNA-binding protein WhiA n=1 Tax=Mycoplasmopsis agassizii TaxID=33922 RepID=A0ABX4H6I8_9BACT|nr:DNA-binding protein WhiA [Mycoplasmopsis agassizii]PAF55525.1 DNA-binding protein WhiA [Mycoplasmopsis agassizii]SMC17969.1 hypothetical protein SAMN02745179_00571 [Mycoplasmopsis agassizii]
MSFTLNLKNEILRLKYNEKEFKELINGFITVAGEPDSYNQNILSCRISNEAIRMKLLSLAIINNIEQGISNKRKDLIIFSKTYFKSLTKINKKYVWAYFAGIFLARGSISSGINTGHHLEFLAKSEETLKEIQDYFRESDLEFNFKIIKRKERYVAYLKKKDEISDFLKFIKAKDSFFAFMENILDKDTISYAAKQANLDLLNSSKIVKASKEHLIMIDFIFNKELEYHFSQDQIFFFKLKKENPYDSLESLKEYLEEEGINISRSGLHHWIRKLKKIYNSYK